MIAWDSPSVSKSFRIPTGPTSSGIDWNSSRWGKAGQNVHESETGSWVPDHHNQTSEE